jgi:hypothetical protein
METAEIVLLQIRLMTTSEAAKKTTLLLVFLIPRGQPINEIIVSRYSMNNISAIVDAYKAKSKEAKQYCRIFDTKELVSKQDTISNLKTKVPVEDIKKLA